MHVVFHNGNGNGGQKERNGAVAFYPQGGGMTWRRICCCALLVTLAWC